MILRPNRDQTDILRRMKGRDTPLFIRPDNMSDLHFLHDLGYVAIASNAGQITDEGRKFLADEERDRRNGMQVRG